MEDTHAIRQILCDLFRSQRLGVLSTSRSGQPYASLIAFYATEDLKRFYFVTPRSTRKFRNLSEEPRISILVNSSTNQDDDFHRAIAVTMVGTAGEIDLSAKPRVLESYLIKHPYLEDFVRSPTSAMVEVYVKSYYMVQNFQHVTELHLSQ
jgi:nitroimidazol reductase NimA-like FMN-containing flavoprotein (pyridoxamine 5'-phosphate oxidase superfamily)